MKINVLELKHSREANYIFKKEFDGFEIGQDKVQFVKPVQLKVQVNVAGEEILVRGKITAVFKLICNRCLEPYNTEIYVNFMENLIKEDKYKKLPVDEKDDNLHSYKGDIIELDELVKQNIILSLPIKRICSVNCKGLCPQCGKNLNTEKCDCKIDNVDPRLAKLKDFFKFN